MGKYAILVFAGCLGIFFIALHTDSAFGDDATTPKKLLTQKCASCHGLNKVQGALGRKDTSAWEDTIQRMRSKGARVGDAEQASLATYLGGLKAGDTL